MRFFHIAPSHRIASICATGLHARSYGAHAVLLGEPSSRALREHLNFYRNVAFCHRPGCSVVVVDLPPAAVQKYISDPHGRIAFPKRGEVYRYYRALRRPLPRRYVKGYVYLNDARVDSLLHGESFRPCPKVVSSRRYVRRGKLLTVPHFAGS